MSEDMDLGKARLLVNSSPLSRPVHHVNGEHVGLRLARYRWMLGPSVVQLKVADSV